MIKYVYKTGVDPSVKRKQELEKWFEDYLGIFKEEFEEKVLEVTINSNLPQIIPSYYSYTFKKEYESAEFTKRFYVWLSSQS